MVQGGTQALSRSLFASMIPRHKSSEFFAFFSVFERYAGVLGPAIFAFVVERSGSGRAAILAVAVFFVIGAAILTFVDVDRGPPRGARRRGGAPSSVLRWRGPRPVIRWLARAITLVFYRVDRAGAVPAAGPVLLLPNHPERAARSGGDLGNRRTGRPVPREVDAVRRRLRPDARRRGAIPVYRRLDQGVDASRNAETFAAVDTALADGDAVCIFPEGISHSTGRLEPLRTGAARMAIGAERRRHPRSTLVAVGLNFDRKTAFRSRVTCSTGGRSRVARSRGDADEQAAVRLATDAIADQMRRLLVEADPESDAAMVARVERLYSAARGRPRSPEERIARRQAIARGIERLRADGSSALRCSSRCGCAATISGCGASACATVISTGTSRRARPLAFALREGAAALLLLPTARLPDS